MGEDYIKILSAFIDNGSKADNLRACADNYQQLEFAVVGEVDVFIIGFHFLDRKTE